MHIDNLQIKLQYLFIIVQVIIYNILINSLKITLIGFIIYFVVQNNQMILHFYFINNFRSLFSLVLPLLLVMSH
jgi:hypothetical protein